MTDEQRPESRSVGRPSLYSPELAARFCERMIDGESLRSICRDESMPCASSIALWRRQHAEFSAQYEIAREIRADLGFDDIQEVADNGTNDWMEVHDPENPGYRANGEHIQRSRLRVDTMKWRLARMNPKQYGEKSAHELSGPNGGAIPVRDETPGLGAVKAALAGMLVRASAPTRDGAGE